MAEGKIGPNLQAGAGLFAKKFQKSLNRAQEKVLQKLGKTMETRDEQFELCSQNLNKQQLDGSRLFKDVKAYYAAVKAVHETSKRLSQTLRDVYEADWNGAEDLPLITDSEDLLWNDFEEKLNDQIVRTVENYTSQFPEVKERVSKRGRKLVDYDSARHHLEALQSAKKKDEAKMSKAEEEFTKAQNVFEEINNELREELPVLYQSRIGCYVTVFQNISNLRDVFYKEMSVLNNQLYSVMKKVETQHSGKSFIIKGLNSLSGKTKKRKSVVISNPIPCNTAFPADHVSILSQNGKDSAPLSPGVQSQSTTETPGSAEEESKDASSSDSDLSSSCTNTPKRLSINDLSERGESPEEAELPTNQSDDSGVGRSEAVCPEATNVPDDEEKHNPDQDEAGEPPAANPPPVPAPRLSFRSTERLLRSATQEQEEDESENQTAAQSGDDDQNPPGFLYKAVAVESHTTSDEGLLKFEQGDVILVLADPKEDGLVRGVREESWKLQKDVENCSGRFMEKLIQPVETE